MPSSPDPLPRKLIMSLIDVKQYLQHRGEASLDDIANHFGAETETVLGMLEHWQKRGRIRSARAVKCAGCTQCGCRSTELYSWVA